MDHAAPGRATHPAGEGELQGGLVARLRSPTPSTACGERRSEEKGEEKIREADDGAHTKAPEGFVLRPQSFDLHPSASVAWAGPGAGSGVRRAASWLHLRGSPDMSPRVGLVVAFGSCWSADAARSPFRAKEVVAGAHPYLKRRFAEAGRLVPADFEAASRLPFRKPSLRSGPSRLGGKNYDITAAQCANYSHTDACYDGDASVIDDDAVLGAPSDPGACARCGYFPEGAPSTFMDCVECADEGDTIVVLYDDCTGLCADADAAAYFAALGFGDLDTSACVLYPNCYDDFMDYATDGTVDQYVSNDDGGASYSYSFSYAYGYGGACSENCATCDGPGSADCASCDEGYELTGDTDGDGFGFCTAVAVPTLHPPLVSRLHRQERRRTHGTHGVGREDLLRLVQHGRSHEARGRLRGQGDALGRSSPLLSHGSRPPPLRSERSRATSSRPGSSRTCST